MGVKEEIQQNIDRFTKLEDTFKKKPSLNFALSLVDILMTGIFGTYYSDTLESFFVNYGEENKKIKKDFESITPKKKSYLHVVTKAYLSGGHTRVIERWIDICNDSEKHSVVLLKQTNSKRIPNKLKKVVSNKGGDFIVFNSSQNIIDKSNKLRDLAFDYETIILHHHPDDPVPLMAFSVKEFKRPVICFNHSGHTFWIGSKIVDHCIDIEKNQNDCTIRKRGVRETTIVDMPVDAVIHDLNTKTVISIKEELGIAKDKLIVLSMASMYKYTPVNGIDFVYAIRKILKEDKKRIFIGIGITATTESWKSLIKDFKERVFLLGYIKHDNVSKYLKETDLYIDSFPYNSWVSLIDAINVGKCPCLVLKTPVGYPNFMNDTYSLCNSVDELINKADIILKSEKKREDLFKDLNEVFLEKCSKEYFKNQIKEVVNKVKLKEKLKVGEISNEIASFDMYNYSFRMAPNIKEKGIKNLFQLIRTKKGVSKINEFIFFGVKMFRIENNKLSRLFRKHNVV